MPNEFHIFLCCLKPNLPTLVLTYWTGSIQIISFYLKSGHWRATRPSRLSHVSRAAWAIFWHSSSPPFSSWNPCFLGLSQISDFPDPSGHALCPLPGHPRCPAFRAGSSSTQVPSLGVHVWSLLRSKQGKLCSCAGCALPNSGESQGSAFTSYCTNSYISPLPPGHFKLKMLTAPTAGPILPLLQVMPPGQPPATGMFSSSLSPFMSLNPSPSPLDFICWILNLDLKLSQSIFNGAPQNQVWRH